jgi:hypothetical protein
MWPDTGDEAGGDLVIARSGVKGAVGALQKVARLGAGADIAAVAVRREDGPIQQPETMAIQFLFVELAQPLQPLKAL